LLCVSSAPAPESLKQQIEQRIQSADGQFAVAYKDLQDGETVLINEKETFHAASTMKVPVMIEVFKQAGEGKFKLDDEVVLKNEFKSLVDGSPFSVDPADDSDSASYELIGQKVTIRYLVERMIRLSSNLTTNVLIELVGARNATRTMRSLGANNIKVLRGVEDGKAFRQGLLNTTTAYDLLLIAEAIAGQTLISKEACKNMIEIMLRQEFKDKIPARLPPEVKVAHKTGSITGVEHDFGIVFLPDGRTYVLAILSKDLKSGAQGRKTIAEISRMIFDHVVSKRKSLRNSGGSPYPMDLAVGQNNNESPQEKELSNHASK
jgi:beta-lactamase class A